MPSQYFDEKLAKRCRSFRFEFAKRPLAGCTVVVAGGAGGLGSALVALLAKEGARLIVGYRSNRARAEALRAAIEDRYAQKITLVEGDIARPEVRGAYLDAVENIGGRSKGGGLLHAAAIFPGDPARVSFEAMNQKAMEASLEANFLAPILLAKDLGTAMDASAEDPASPLRAAGGGSIVLLASMQAVAAFPSSLNYAAPKAALVHAARVLAAQWKHVRVNVVAPGATVAGMAEASVSSGKYDSFVEKGTIPRFGRPEDVARAVRFFLEPDGYATGQVLVIDGGLTLRR
ncbi:MAG: SDR family oxidoreductase [Acidobacteria bacterium]|nr:SDR family oxidoreductase [Acidobacteriota bacterium]MBI3664274.1 SDR family oxidoreductase [Acidobacteriota bacterium]